MKRNVEKYKGLMVPYNTIDANICIGAVDQKHICACRGVLHDGGVEGGGGENGDVVVHVVHQNCYRPRSAQRRRTWR